MQSIRKFTVCDTDFGFKGGNYTVKKDRGTPVSAGHKASRRVWKEAEKNGQSEDIDFINLRIREINTKDCFYNYRGYQIKLSKPRTYFRGGKKITSEYEYVAVPCPEQELNEKVCLLRQKSSVEDASRRKSIPDSSSS
nr:hypothetical protein TetV2_00130 [Oceanusvirus sp.]